MKQSLFAIAVSIFVAACCPAVDGRESPGDKREWSVLQSLELQTRDERANALQFRTIDEFKIVGVPHPESGRLIWIMLNPGHSPFYKQMPEGDYTLSRADFDTIVREHGVTATVEEVLRSHKRSS